MNEISFMGDSLVRLLSGVPLALALALIGLLGGGVLATGLVAMRLSRIRLLSLAARAYVFVFRGTPLLIQLFLIYYGLSQFRELRASIAWPYLRDPFWCASLALMLNTAAYSSEVLRAGLLAVPAGQVEAARACGMSPGLAFRRIVAPIALRRILPAYGNEIILMVKATSLASTVTLMEITGIAAVLISQTYRSIEVFVCAGAVYLAINFAVTRLIKAAEYWLSPETRSPRTAQPAHIRFIPNG